MIDVEGRIHVSMRLGEPNVAVGHDRVDVVYATGDEALQQMKRLTIPELIEYGPELVGRVEFSNPDGGRRESRLEHPRWRNSREVLPDAVVVQDRDELGDRNTALHRAH